MIEVGIAATTQVFVGLCGIPIVQREFAEMIVDFAQPCRMRRLVCVLQAPGEFLLCSLSLVKISWKFSVHDTGDPVHDENLTT